jgi:2-succinyl-5-enolpyruvyl-6-hydroxy-3-cyclohexene-1-carboxylate synthase
MLAPNRTLLFPFVFADELARAGLRHVCIAPGSRSAPLALAFARQSSIQTWSHVDERSGGFFALGLARARRAPVAVVCTSGTAAANLLPAVVEAWHAQVPLLVLTADRPPELRDCGAGQTIDQLRLFGTHARWFFDVGTPEATPAALRHARTLACRALAAAAGPPAGPVHLNFPFREPLVAEPVPGDLPPDLPRRAPLAAYGRPERPYTEVSTVRQAPDPAAVGTAASLLAAAPRPLVLCGPLDDGDPDLPAAVIALATALRAPVLAEITSNLRGTDLAAVAVDAHDALLRSAAFARGHVPGAVVRLGGPPTSKALATWLAHHDDALQILIDGSGGWPEPAGVAACVLRGTPALTASALAAAVGDATRGGEWFARWRRAGAVARNALGASVEAEPAPFEAHAVDAIARVLPRDAILYVGNSLAIRALDAFWPADALPGRVLANRGANGIDGFVSSVLGAAAAGCGPVVGLCGDLAFYHDMNGLLAAKRHGVRAVLVVLHNDGGGIFDFLPVARSGAGYEELFATPHGLDFELAARMYGASFQRITGTEGLGGALEEALAAPATAIVELRFTRETSVAAHGRAWARTRAALEELR